MSVIKFNNKNLLIVDLESQYISSDDYMGLIDVLFWNVTQTQMKKQYLKIIKKVKRLKQSGWTIYFTGEPKPFGEFKYLIDVTLPYWAENRTVITEIFSEKSVVIGGLFWERCVKEVHLILQNSYILRKMCISHGIIGDSPLFKTNNLKMF